MSNTTNYHVLFYGGPDRHQANRPLLTPCDSNTVAGYLRFTEPCMEFESDGIAATIIRIQLRSNLF